MELDESLRSLLILFGMGFVPKLADELHAFAVYLNRIFTEADTQEYRPIDSGDGGHDLLSKLVDGVILAKMINFAVPDTIDER